MTQLDSPAFVDNTNGNTLAEAIARHVRGLRGENRFLWGIDVATGFFDLTGFGTIASDLETAGTVRLLFGAELPPEASVLPPIPGDPPEPERTRRRSQSALE